MVDLTEYYGLVVHLARQSHQQLSCASAKIDLDDLIQEGMLGLLQAARAYNPQARTRFTTFAYPRIVGAIKDALRRLDLLSQKKRHQVRTLQLTRTRLLQVVGREPLKDELTDLLNLPDAALDQLESLNQIEEVLAGLDPDLEAKIAPDQEEEHFRQRLREEVHTCLAETLDEAEKRVLLLRFWAGLTLEKVGALMDRPPQTIYKIELRARRKLKEYLEGKGWEVEDVLEVIAEKG